MKKRLLATVLAFCLAITNVYAVGTHNSMIDLGINEMNAEMRIASNAEMIEKLAYNNNTVLRSGEVQEAEAVYDVSFEENEDGLYANMYFEIGELHGNVSGKVEERQLSTGEVYISGPLRGKVISSSGDNYDVIVGLQTSDRASDISAAVNIKVDAEHVFFAFGSYIMPDEVYAENTIAKEEMSANNDVHVLENEIGIMSNNESDDFVGYTEARTRYEDTNTVINKLKPYYSENRNVLVAVATSNAEGVLSGGLFTSSRVYEAVVGFESEDRDSFIDRFYYVPGEDGIRSAPGGFIHDVFEMLLEMTTRISVPAATILDLVANSLAGGTDTYTNATKTYAEFSTQISRGDFDDSGLPVAVQLEANPSGDYNYTITSDITYLCVHLKDTYYVDADTASRTISIDVD